MANLPTVNDREVLTSLRNQEALLENIARAVSKRDDTLSKRSDKIMGDKRVIDDQQDKSMIRKIIESFTKMGGPRMNAQEIQIKTLEEAKLTRNIAQRTGLDIEFIRKSFEEGQKKKEREMLAEAIQSGIGDRGRGSLATMFSGLAGAIVSGLKVVSNIIATSFKSILKVFSIPGLTAIFKGALLAKGVATALALGTPSDTQTDEFENDETYKGLMASGPGSEAFERNVSEAAQEKFYREFMDEDPKAKEWLDAQPAEIYDRVKKEFFEGLREKNSYLIEQYQTVYAEVNKKFEDDYNAMIEKYKVSARETKDRIGRNEDSLDSIDIVMEEGNKLLDKVAEGLEGVAGMVSGSKILDKIKESFLSLGSLKFHNPNALGGVEELNLMDATGGMLKGLYDMATDQLKSTKEEAQESGNSVNTQVNNTNVINGGSAPVPFPNASVINDFPSVVRHLQNQGTIRY